ncbi:hypothetical protein [Pendulispora albinea]|uniref:Right-handed parallel beta-helix repeat-containing protein n=1 Tax=Pendulispora albinea TaxID=2741071 RepID=A0ABZ2M209_9BACT
MANAGRVKPVIRGRMKFMTIRNTKLAFTVAIGAFFVQACAAQDASTDEKDRPELRVRQGDVRSSASSLAANCTRQITIQDELESANPGDVVCFQSSMKKSRLKITKGGTPDAPIVYSGENANVDGITIEASNVIVQNYTLVKPNAPGIWAEGNNITLQNNTIVNPVNGDGDGIRFFGNDIKILHNTVRGTSNRYGHADCMQTYASDTPPSRNVLIEGNRCEKIDNMCLMAEGPNDGEGDGRGHSDHFTIRNNFCETLKASQTLMFEDIQYATITGNEFAGSPTKAIGLAIKSTFATVSGNIVSPDIDYEVGIDSSSKKGYQGPPPGGKP